MPSILLDWQPLKPVRTKGSNLTLKLKKYEFFSLDVATKVYKTCVKLEVLNCTISEIFAYWGNFRVFMLIVVILWYFSNFKGSCLCYTNSNWGDFFFEIGYFFQAWFIFAAYFGKIDNESLLNFFHHKIDRWKCAKFWEKGIPIREFLFWSLKIFGEWLKKYERTYKR